ncbi:Segregation and condensation protein A [uncultured archaeon]|nr:Segregation and condensation protein A [uncultured archaeon]
MQAEQVREDLEGGISHAQADVQVDVSSIDQIEQLVNKATWRELLLDIVTANSMDPWNIDIGVITNSYIDKVRKMKIQDLHVPANVILAASILLRFKAQSFRFEEPEPAHEDVTVFEGMPGESAEMQLLQLKMRMQPKRAVTLSDLLVALDEAITIETKREVKRVAIPKMF